MLRKLSKLAFPLVSAVFLAPVVALVPSAFFDQGEDGRVRVSFFSLALTVLDPFVWTCLWNSIAVATITTALALGVGVPVGRLLVRERFGNAWTTLAMAVSGMAVPPAYAALGWLEAIRTRWPRSLDPTGLDPSWLILILSYLSNALPFVIMITIFALRKANPNWEDAARLAGASPRNIWRKIHWPSVRPEIARASVLIFGFSLLDPGTPTLLGLRRTIGYQVVQAVKQGPLLGRAATLALLGMAVMEVGRLLIGWWGGTPSTRSTSLSNDRSPYRRQWSLTRILALSSAIGVVTIALGFPAIGLLEGVHRFGESNSAGTLTPLRRLLEEPLLRNAVRQSVWVGCCVAAVDIGVVMLLSTGANLTETRRRLNSLSRLTERFPPLVYGLGALLIPSLLSMGLSRQDGRSWWNTPNGSTFLLVWALAPLRFSLLGRSKVETTWEHRPSTIDTVLLSGGSRRQSPSEGWGGISFASILLTFSIAANAVAPAVLLAKTAECRTIGPTLLRLHETPMPGGAFACTLALCGIALNLGSFLWIAAELRSRPSEPI